MKKLFFLLAASVVLFYGCSSRSENGELVGVLDRSQFEDIDLKAWFLLTKATSAWEPVYRTTPMV